MKIKIETPLDIDYPIPFEVELRLEKEHKAELRKLESETDWVEIIGEAETVQVIKEKQVEFAEQIGDLTALWKLDLQFLDEQNVTGFDRYFFETLYQCRYAPQIQQIIKRAQQLIRLYTKHRELKYPSQFVDDYQINVTDTQIEKAKEVPLNGLFEDRGGKLIQAGQNYKTLCPFHLEKTPSCTIYTESNNYHCFGCSAHGDSITFTMKTKGLNFPDSVRLLVGGVI